MGTYKIALVPGDGIGTEVLNEGVKVLKALEKEVGGFAFTMDTYDAGAECYKKTGTAMPEATFKACKESDAIFWGSAGLPGVVYPDGTEAGVEAGLRMRFGLDLYANVRPVKLYPNVPQILAGKKAGDIDYVIIRENVEGLYASRGGGNITHDKVAVDSLVITRWETERITKFAFELARSRSGAPADGKKRVTSVDKANILRTWSFWRRVFNDVAAQNTDIEKDYAYVDAMSCWMVQKPEFYDVCVMENMLGDILTDLGAATVGGMGMSPSAEIGDNNALFQGSGGTAPTIAGKGIANPTATIVSGRMMLEWLAGRFNDANLKKAADLLEEAVVKTFEQGTALTSDIGGKASTSEMGDAVVANIKKLTAK